jgi:tetratricopeptide (TPR) repeat protein
LLPQLGGLPLALAQAGAYLGATGMSVADYLEHYDTTWTALMKNQDQFPLQEYGERSVLTTWTMSYEQVKGMDPLAAQLLDLWAFLYHGDMWAELVLAGQSDEAQHRPHEAAVFRPMTKLSLQHSIGTLVQYSMVSMSTADRAPTIHPVVHMWCLHSLGKSTKQQFMAAALGLVARMAESLGRGVGKELGLRLAAHAKTIGTREGIDGSDEAEQAKECHQVANFLSDWEKSKEVENLYIRALRGYEKAWDAEHTSTLETVNNLGSLYYGQGKMAEAEAMYMRALRGFEKALGTEHTWTLEAVHNLGALYADQGKMAEAEEMYLRALRGFEKACGADHTSTLETINNLGALYADQGQTAKAEEMLLRALCGREKAWGVEHTSTLETVNNLGNLYSNQGKMAEAEEMYMRALRGYEKLPWVPPVRVESVRQSLSSLRRRSNCLHSEQASKSIPHVEDNCAIPSKTSPKRGSRENPVALSRLLRKMWKRS